MFSGIAFIVMLSSQKDGSILFNQEQPLVWLGCSHTPSSNCDCEIFQKNSRVGHSTTLCYNYPNGSLHSMLTQHLQRLGAELTIMKPVLEAKT